MVVSWWDNLAAFGGPWGVFMLVMAIAIVGVAFYINREAAQQGEFTSAMPDRRDEFLARLDRERAEGRLTEDEYQSRRRDLDQI